MLQQPSVRDITIQTLMMDGSAQEVIDASGTDEDASPTAEQARKSAGSLMRFCHKNADDLARRNIRFECRASSRVPFVHGFLMRGHKLLLTMLLMKNGKMAGTPNPYWDLDYPKTASTSRRRTVRYSFEAYEQWFDQQWEDARLVWPTEEGS